MTKARDLLVRLLGAGVTLSASCLVAGLILTLADHAVGGDHATAHPLVRVGLIILMATPLVRVLASLVDEIRRRNWFFAGVTLVVLAVLGATLLIAL